MFCMCLYAACCGYSVYIELKPIRFIDSTTFSSKRLPNTTNSCYSRMVYINSIEMLFFTLQVDFHWYFSISKIEYSVDSREILCAVCFC